MPDENTQQKPETVTGPWSLAAFAMNRYGSYSFSLISVIVLYVFMFQPNQERDRAQAELLQQVVVDLKDAASTLERTAEHQKATSTVLDKITSRVVVAGSNE